MKAPPTGSYHFIGHESNTATATKAKLMSTYLREVEEEADALYGRWKAALGRVASDLKVPQKDEAFAVLSKEVQKRVRFHLSSPGSYGFDSAQDAEAFLDRCKVADVFPSASIQFYVRLPNGNRSGGMIVIHP